MPRLRTITIAVIAAIIILSTTAGFTTALTRGHPEITVFLEDDRVTAGGDVTLGVHLLNGGDQSWGSGSARDEERVTTARNVQVTLRDGRTPIEIETPTQPAGNVPEGVTGPIEFTGTVNENAEPGTYRLPVRLEYRYTDQILSSGSDSNFHTETTVIETQYVEVRVIPSSRFDVQDASLNTLIDNTGNLTLDLQNIGEADATATRVEVTSHDSQLTFAGETTIETFLGSVPARTTRTIDVEAELDPEAENRSYPVSVDVTYEDTDGEIQTADTLTTGVAFENRRSRFAVSNAGSTLTVGEEGQLTGTIENTGTSRIRNAVVVFTTTNPNVNPIGSEYSIGDLEPNQASSFSFDVDTSENAAPGPRLFTVEVRYRDANNLVKTSNSLDMTVLVGPKRQVFSVDPIQTTVNTGETAIVTLRTTNTGDEPVYDISAKLFTNTPLSSGDDEAFIPRLDPDESTNISFLVTAGGGALAKSYPVSIDFQYDDEDNDTLLSDTYRVPITVESTQRSNDVIIGLVLVVLAVLIISGYYVYRRST